MLSWSLRRLLNPRGSWGREAGDAGLSEQRVEAGVEDDSKMVSEIEEAEDISGNSAFGPQTPSSPSTPLTISQSHKKS